MSSTTSPAAVISRGASSIMPSSSPCKHAWASSSSATSYSPSAFSPHSAGLATVFLTGLLAWALGGLCPAQALAMLGVLIVPSLHLPSTASLHDPLRARLLDALRARAHSSHRRRFSQPFWWTIFKFSAGIGLLNKPSIAFFLDRRRHLGLLLTQQRRTSSTSLGRSRNRIPPPPPHRPALRAPADSQPLAHPRVSPQRQGRNQKNVILGPMGFFLAHSCSDASHQNALLRITGVILSRRRTPIPPHGSLDR